MPAGVNTCSDGYEAITSVQDCVEAGRAVGVEYQVSGSWDHAVGGCILTVGGAHEGNVYLNTHEGTENAEHAKLCKRSATTPTSTTTVTQCVVAPNRMATGRGSSASNASRRSWYWKCSSGFA